ncbi:MAG: bifunctional 4-hydroxy-2-oxoglutarate aldolase/2-dehydro-3-deoxy-phosphogluconate aldolase [Solirubrobacterales bacterium]|nr:bifunctional 4-hydroxy-2-oxoglutarate aldolase/2-dehydro-3-deoxy-phosphogluconate aldolase [Solirubrobacterales bacterium]
MTTTAPARQIVDQLGDVRIVPVTSFETPEQAHATATALMRGGITCIEVTFRTAAAAECIARVSGINGLLIGAGTLLSPDQVQEAIAAGAHFGVAPGTNVGVIEAARDSGLPFFPGVATPSEIERVRSLGISTVKVFPAGPLGGPAFLKAVAAVYPDVKFMPTGGVDAGSVAEYASAPGVLAVGGSWVASTSLIREDRYDEIERLAREARETLSSVARP